MHLRTQENTSYQKDRIETETLVQANRAPALDQTQRGHKVLSDRLVSLHPRLLRKCSVQNVRETPGGGESHERVGWLQGRFRDSRRHWGPAVWWPEWTENASL